MELTWYGRTCIRLRGGLPKEWKIGDKTGNNGKDAPATLRSPGLTPADRC